MPVLQFEMFHEDDCDTLTTTDWLPRNDFSDDSLDGWNCAVGRVVSMEPPATSPFRGFRSRTRKPTRSRGACPERYLTGSRSRRRYWVSPQVNSDGAQKEHPAGDR